jgi:hypothetical protein
VTEGTAVLLGALVGAVAGLAGGGFAALASVRAGQLTARAALGPILQKIADTVVWMNTTKGTEEYLKARREFERGLSEFSIQQRILCPSERIANLMDLVRAIGRNQSDPIEAVLNLAGQTMEKVTRMVGAHSNHVFRCSAHREEAKIIGDWLKSEQATLLSEAVRTKLSVLL